MKFFENKKSKWLPNMVQQTDLYYKISFFWLAIVAIFVILLQMPLLGLHLHPYFTYGKLKPAIMNLLVFGCFSFLFQGFCLRFVAERRKTSAEKDSPFSLVKWYPLFLLVSLGLAILTIVLGTWSILANMSAGRELGEYPFFFDQTWILSQLIFLYVISMLGKSIRTEFLYQTLTGIIILQIAYYIIGNLGFPYRLDLMGAIPFFTGYADVSTNEIYRNGIMVFYVILPLIFQLGHWLPHYAAQEKFVKLKQTQKSYSIFQEKSFPIFLFFTLILPPIAQIGLLYTPVASSLQIFNVIGYILLQSNILMGALLVRKAILRESKIFGQEMLGLLFRFGIFILIVRSIIQMIIALPFISRYFGYSAVSNTYVFPDLFSYGIILFLSIAVYSRKTLSIRKENANADNLDVSPLQQPTLFLTFPGVTLIVIMIISIVAGAMETILAVVKTNQWESIGQLGVLAWADIYFAASVNLSSNTPAILQTLLSTKGIHIFSSIAVGISLLTVSIWELWRRKNLLPKKSQLLP